MKYSIIREINNKREVIRKTNSSEMEAMSFVEHLNKEVKLAYTTLGKTCNVKYILLEN